MSQEPQEKPSKSGFRPLQLLVIGLMIVIALGLAAGGALMGGYAWLGYKFEEAGPRSEDTIYMSERGRGLIAIAHDLEREGLITDARIFRVKVTLEGGERSLKAGEYAIPAHASMAEIYEILRKGESIQYPVTVAEGLTSAMIVRILNDVDVLTGEITDIPAEGSLLPETYMVVRGTSRQDVITRMQAAHDDVLAELWANRQDGLPIETPEDAVILASVVEKETGLAAERPLVASVFVNRLRRGMRLESDPTIIYGISQGEPLGRGLRRSELDNADNPYNTYHINRLPPTPIANPGEAALAAVLNPPESDYLFFVADGTGGHAFAETYNEHLRNVREWRRIERQRR